MSIQRVLIVDDEPDIRELLEITLGRMRLDTYAAANLQQARQLLNEQDFDLCLTDMRLPDGDGIELVEFIQQQHPNLPVAMLTAYGSVETAVQALKAGAFDFISKPVDLKVLRDLIQSALSLSENPAKLSPVPSSKQWDILGESPAIQQLKQTIEKLARSQAPVYIHGESGSGKELVAREIHKLSARNDKPFIPVNCGAIPSELMESEFFGHYKGSFTGASADKDGLFQAAQGGTLFLDEVAELPLAMQVKLLRAIQERAIKPVGGHQELPVDVRILSATHKDLQIEMAANRFRQDLYYRLNVIELSVPPLRERMEDLPLLSHYLLQKLAKRWASITPSLDPQALAMLEQYSFPGNVRELENILERAATLCENNQILADDLQLPEPSASLDSAELTTKPLSLGKDTHDLSNLLDDQAKTVILNALDKTDGNKTAAAKLLGLSFRQLRYRLKKLNIS